MAPLARLTAQIDEIEALLAGCPLELRAAQVSGWSVGEQLDHVTQVLAAGLGLVEFPRETPRRGINLTGRLLLALEWIPRGVAKSPKSVLPKGAGAAELRERLAGIRAGLNRLAAEPNRLRDPRPVVPHPFFGGLSAAQGLRFLEVHTRHHLKIVRDIRKAAGHP